MIFKRTEKWFSGARKNLFTSRNGFFELPCLADSPETIIQGLDRMPFVKHCPKEQKASLKSPFVNGTLCYRKIEPGLWIMCGDFTYKTNINYKNTYDKYFSSGYYFLSLEINGAKGKGKQALVNGNAYSNPSWLLFKPRVNTTNCHFKGAKVLTFTLFFDQEWLDRVFYREERFIRSELKDFFGSDARFLILPASTQSTDAISRSILAAFSDQPGASSDPQVLAYNFLSTFIERYEQDETTKDLFKIPETDRVKINEAEHLLMKDIYGPFVGIEALARQAGLAPTLLKNYFKLVYGETAFQYFQSRQMKLAKDILQKQQIAISELARRFGYENPSKFSAAFENHTGMLPSEAKAQTPPVLTV